MDIQFYYAGENSRQTYEYAAPALTKAAEAMSKRSPRFDWDRATNTLRVLVVTPADIDPQGEYKKHDWSSLPPCGSNSEKTSIDMASYVDVSARKFYGLLRTSVKAGFIPEPIFNEAVLNAPAGVTSLNGIVAATAMPQMAGVINIGREMPELGRNYIVLNMPDTPPAVAKVVQDISGLDIKYLKGIKGTDKDWSLATLGHEVAGHGLHGHVVGEASKYNCTLIDYDFSDETVRHEGLSDIALVETVKAANSLGMMSGEDILPAWESVRVLGSFFKNSNAYNLKTGSGIDAHTTTLLFDPAQPETSAAFNQVSAKGISALPILINTYADYVAGYVYAHQKHQAVKSKARVSTPYERKLFRNLGGEIMLPDMLASYGSYVRFGKDADEQDSKIIATPAYHVEAMKYLKKTGGLDAIRSELAPALQPAFDDLVADYFKAIESHGSSLLVSTQATRHFDSAFKGIQLGYSTLTSILFKKPVPGMKNDDLVQYRKELGLDQSVPAFLIK